VSEPSGYCTRCGSTLIPNADGSCAQCGHGVTATTPAGIPAITYAGTKVIADEIDVYIAVDGRIGLTFSGTRMELTVGDAERLANALRTATRRQTPRLKG
jgi:RNA polymerase subunit RPABC4/transcription elongation factor Spt4